MGSMRSIAISSLAIFFCVLGSCNGPQPKPYGQEGQLSLPGSHRLVWAIAPTQNLSGQPQVDPLLQSDIVFQETQQIHGLTVIPVDRVVQVYASLRLEKVQSEEQASLVCDLLHCDGLIVPTVTAFDPYEPPKFAGSLQLFTKPGSYARPNLIDPRELARSAAPGPDESVAPLSDSLQSVAMLDAADGSVIEKINRYATGRNNPNGPYGAREITVSMDRYCGFAYHELLAGLLEQMQGPTTRPN